MNKELVYQVVKSIPEGKVATYGQIAKLAGIKNARIVGNILHHNPDPASIPCHRVVNAKGQVAKKFAFGGGERQRKILEAEGVVFRGDRVDLSVCGWDS